MGIHENPWVIQADSYSAEVFRRQVQATLLGGGIVAPGALQVTQNGTPNMSVNVAAGEAFIPGTLGGSSAGLAKNATAQTGYGLPANYTSQGMYYAWNDGTVNLTISASNPSLGRYDNIVLEVNDAQYSGALNNGVLSVVTGVPSGSPANPGAPNNSVVLATIFVGAGVTSITSANITDERVAATSNPYRTRVYRGGSWTTAASGVFVFDTVSYDPSTSYNTSTGMYICPVAGYYDVYSIIGFSSTAANQRESISILKNGSTVSNGQTAYSNASSQGTTGLVRDVIKCSAGDQLQIEHNEGGATGISGLTGTNLVYATFAWTGN